MTIGHHVQRGEWEKALDVMCKQQDPNTFYKYAPVLIRELPGPTVSVLLQFTPGAPQISVLVCNLARFLTGRSRTEPIEAHTSPSAIRELARSRLQ